MGDTWGISGPAFLGIFVLLLLGAGLVAPLALDRRVARADAGGGHHGCKPCVLAGAERQEIRFDRA
ncbi:hypothetical protein [Actinomycetospora sp. NBC_00405]|uniref:hypothetical protein n=1 Tax=Actinomycetospora sp. NBC_00405 TaxID=2975952 RepID=UPI002E1FD814